MAEHNTVSRAFDARSDSTKQQTQEPIAKNNWDDVDQLWKWKMCRCPRIAELTGQFTSKTSTTLSIFSTPCIQGYRNLQNHLRWRIQRYRITARIGALQKLWSLQNY
eukprot:scaffold3453_cov256-Chaetoceros_neogracile.AAC.39